MTAARGSNAPAFAIWNPPAASGVVSALVPVALLLLARRYVISALTFGAVREKA